MSDKTTIDNYIERLDKSLGLSNVKRNVEDNKIYFEYKDIEYRLRMPNYKEKKIINTTKRNTYLKLVAEKIPCEKLLIEQLKQSGKSIEKIQKEIDNLEIDKEKYQELLAKEAKPDEKRENKKVIDELIKEIETIVYKQVTLISNKMDLLSPCLENQIKESELEAIILNLFEKKVEENWLPVYVNKEELDNEIDQILLDHVVGMARDLGVYHV